MRAFDKDIFAYYEQLPPKPDQVAFRNFINQLYPAISGNWGNLVVGNRMKESPELLEVFDLTNEEQLGWLYDLEKEFFYNLRDHRIISSFGKTHLGQPLFGKKKIDWNWSFNGVDKQAFIDLYNRIFHPEKIKNYSKLGYKEETSTPSPEKSSMALGQEVFTLSFEEIRGKHTILITDERASKKYRLHQFKSKNDFYFIFEHCFRKCYKEVTLIEIKNAFYIQNNDDLDIKRFKESLANYFDIIGFRGDIKKYFLSESSKDSVKIRTTVLDSDLINQKLEYKNLSTLNLKGI